MALLTKRRQKWAAQRKPNVMRGKPLAYPAGVEARYRAGLERLVREMMLETVRELKSTLDVPVKVSAFDASDASQTRIMMNRLSKTLAALFAVKGRKLIEQMTASTFAASKTALHSSMEQLSGGLSLKTDLFGGDMEEITKATIAENVALISSIPEQFIQRLEGEMYRAMAGGKGLSDVVDSVRKYGGMSERRTRLLASDQVKKFYSNVNRERSKELGLTKAEWVHSGGGREPRHSHVKMNGQIYDIEKGCWDETEQKFVQPAELPNCRCTFVPVYEFSEEDKDAA